MAHRSPFIFMKMFVDNYITIGGRVILSSSQLQWKLSSDISARCCSHPLYKTVLLNCTSLAFVYFITNTSSPLKQQLLYKDISQFNLQIMEG